MLLVFDDCGITLEIFVFFIFLLQLLWGQLMYKGGSRGESPSRFVSEVEREEARTFSIPKNTHRNPPKWTQPPSFQPRPFCFAKEQKSAQGEYAHISVRHQGWLLSTEKESQGPHPHGGQEVRGHRCWELSPLLGRGFGPPALGLSRDKVGPGHRGHFSSTSISMARSQISGAGAELASMVTTFCRWIQCRNICMLIFFGAYGAAANALTQQALVTHVEGLTPGTKEVIWAASFSCKGLLSFPLSYLYPVLLFIVLSSVYLFFPSYLKSCLFRSACYCFSGIYLLTASSRVGFTCLILLCSWGNVGRKGTIKSIHFMEWYKHVFSWIDDTEYKALLICASP